MQGLGGNVGRMGREACALVLVLALLAPACVKQPPKDAFNEHWEVQAQKSEGYSPTARPRRIELEKAEVKAKEEVKPETKPERKLPTTKVTLRMYNTDLVVVVRTLARAAGQNVVLSSSIPGSNGTSDKPKLINVSVENAPWDETFKSILTSNNLAYVIEGDIIRVMTLQDMEQQSKLKAEDNRKEYEKHKTKMLEPFVTYRVEVNYSELAPLQSTISSICGNPTTGNDKTSKTTNYGSNIGLATPPEDVKVTETATTQTALQNYLQTDRQTGQLICSAVADRHSNSLIIQGPPEDAEKVVKLIEKLDQPRPQIRIKAFIVQASHDVATQLGVQWGGKYSGNNFQLSPGTTSGSATTGTEVHTLSEVQSTTPIFGGAKSGQGWGVNNPAGLTVDPTGLLQSGTALNFIFGKIGANVLEAQLTTLAAESKLKILSSPTITTMENLSASVENGKDVPYTTTSQNGTNVQWAKATLKLEMLPHVVDGTSLRMKIMVKDDQVDTNQSNWVQGNPIIYKRETQSNLVVEDGDTIIISGLTRDTVNDGQNGLPYLSNIPVLGWAFKSKSKEVIREDMLIFITPTILKEKPIPSVPPVAGQPVSGPDMAMSPSPVPTPSQRP